MPKPNTNRRRRTIAGLKEGTNVVTDLDLFEVSAVDTPAMEGALAMTIKSDVPRDTAKPLMAVAKGGSLVQVATDVVDGHQHGVEIYYSSYDDQVNVYVNYATSEGSENSHSHQLVRNEDGTVSVLMSEGHTHEINSAAFNSALLTVLGSNVFKVKFAVPEDITKQHGDATDEEGTMPKSIKGSDASVTGEATGSSAAEATGSVTAAPEGFETYYDSLPDQKAKDAFLAAHQEVEKAKDAAAQAEAEKAADPVVVKANQERDEALKRIEQLEAVNEDREVAAKANTFKSLGGDVEVKKALARTIMKSGESDEMKEKMEDALRAADNVMALGADAFKVKGHGKDPSANATADVLDMVDMSSSEAQKKLDAAVDEALKSAPAGTKRSAIIAQVQRDNAALVQKARSA